MSEARRPNSLTGRISTAVVIYVLSYRVFNTILVKSFTRATLEQNQFVFLFLCSQFNQSTCFAKSTRWNINLFFKIPPIKNARIQVWTNPRTFTTNGMVMYGQICEKRVPCSKKFQIVQYIRTTIHIIAAFEKKRKIAHSSRRNYITAAS